MNNEQMLAAVLALPGADLMTASKIDDPIGAGNYYRADTVVRLLAAERERCAKIVDMPPGTEAWEVIGGEEGLTMLRELAAQIRSGGQP